MIKPISGFSRLYKREKITWLAETYLKDSPSATSILEQYWNPDNQLQQLHEEFTENTISNYYLPFGIAPNFVINGYRYAIPMAIEESSVIAAASKAAKFWGDNGGFKAKVINTKKIGQVHFMFAGSFEKLQSFFSAVKPKLLESVANLTRNMEKRGGGVLDIELIDKSSALENYFQLHCTFETKDSMGANFINSCLEKFAETFKNEAQEFLGFTSEEKEVEIVMSILSNYVPECVVRAEVSCPVENLGDKEMDGEAFAEKFIRAIKIAEVEKYRAVTHNKGIMNGIDAVVLATGNDFRAIEAGVHAYASRNGEYTSLTHAKVENGIFQFWMEIPLALGTVGGLTSLHPLSKVALEILQKPTAEDLMKIVAVAGLAQNYAAVKSLITTGIQQGHMKMHLMNILNQMNASGEEKASLVNHFKTNTVTHRAVEEALQNFRSK
ncbi:3-hydroxy-3-methylglutaryl coenzyme A reductase [Salinimicrobium marinum]|uniref:3-hydroxy-3-methylglutaryl coenzyme A reductase n=1 Tax=Salinimicrobium marinum TaxID=680283 RepID=A0A918SHP1_9FLAO|nr:hydroxymethylglutaryl-CoA reductase, degradative [Salinimicrobium marinum]GHA42817.1 3-hydroxy-3-methylglutaryl coenzyme A reductase [Salinimicrobium marinum]